MTMPRYAKRRDATEPALVKELRQCGYLVERRDFPDLNVRKLHWPGALCVLLEVDGITQHRKRSAAQLEFLRAWSIPVVKDLSGALQVLDAVTHALRIGPRTSVSCTSPPPGVSTSSVAAL
jgi:hypothetical protein